MIIFKMQVKTWGFTVIFATILFALLVFPNPLPKPVGEGDFRGYWSASYLLARGENFSDPMQIKQVEETQTDWRENWVVVTWNPPWLFVILMPFTFVPFSQAVWWWLLTNVLIVAMSVGAVWQLSTSSKVRRQIWIALLVAFTFSITLVTLVMGQVNTLVLAGLAGFLFFAAREHWGFAGAALALTTIKPQLVYLTLPLLLFDCLLKKRWRAIAGFALTLLGLGAIVFLLRPTFLSEYLALAGTGRLLAWENPTLSRWLSVTLGWDWARMIGLAILPLLLLLRWRYGDAWNIFTLVDASLILSIITAPFAWSYDFVVLLIPLANSLVRFIENRSIIAIFAFITILTSANIVSYYQRLQSTNDVDYVWIPLLIAVLYAWANFSLKRRVSGNG
jgi:hypothetical protein